jgi:hypothetical protein
MDIFQAISLLIQAGNFLLALLSYIRKSQQ